MSHANSHPYSHPSAFLRLHGPLRVPDKDARNCGASLSHLDNSINISQLPGQKTNENIAKLPQSTICEPHTDIHICNVTSRFIPIY